MARGATVRPESGRAIAGCHKDVSKVDKGKPAERLKLYNFLNNSILKKKGDCDIVTMILWAYTGTFRRGIKLWKNVYFIPQSDI